MTRNRSIRSLSYDVRAWRDNVAGITVVTHRASRSNKDRRSNTTGVMFRPVRLDAPTSISIVHRGALGLVGVLVQGAARALTNILIGRVGGPTVLGSVASGISIAQLLSLLWPTSTGSAASKFVARARGSQNYAEAAAVAAHLAKRTSQSSLILAVGAGCAWTVLERRDVVGGFAVGGLVIAYSGYSFTRGLHFGSSQIVRATKWDLICGGLGLLGVLVSLGLGVRGLLLVMPLAVASLLFTFACWPWHAHGRPDPVLRREMDIFVAATTLGTLASAGFLQLSVLAVRLTGGVGDTGQYAAAVTIATPLSIVAGALSLVLYPSMAEAHGRADLDGVHRQTDQSVRFLAVFVVPAIGAVALCSRPLISTIWGASYSDAGYILPLMLLAVLATTLCVPSSNALSSGSRQGVSTVTIASFVGLAVGILVWVVAAREFGVVGVAIGYLAGTLSTSGIAVGAAWRRGHHRWGWLLARLGGGVAVLAGLVVLEGVLNLNQSLDALLAIGFCIVWFVMSGEDVRRAAALVSARLSHR